MLEATLGCQGGPWLRGSQRSRNEDRLRRAQPVPLLFEKRFNGRGQGGTTGGRWQLPTELENTVSDRNAQLKEPLRHFEIGSVWTYGNAYVRNQICHVTPAVFVQTANIHLNPYGLRFIEANQKGSDFWRQDDIQKFRAFPGCEVGIFRTRPNFPEFSRKTCWAFFRLPRRTYILGA
jgi:hypothetical protein